MTKNDLVVEYLATCTNSWKEQEAADASRCVAGDDVARSAGDSVIKVIHEDIELLTIRILEVVAQAKAMQLQQVEGSHEACEEWLSDRERARERASTLCQVCSVGVSQAVRQKTCEEAQDGVAQLSKEAKEDCPPGLC